MTDFSDITEKDLERLAKDFGKAMPEHLKERVLKQVRQLDRETDIEKLLDEISHESNDTPEISP